MNTKICPVCKTPIPANAPGGFCPACILRDADEPAPAGRAAPSLAEIAAAFPQLEIESLIGQGGMGFVYKARQPALDRVVALKILAPELSRDPAFAERFAREARVLGKLNHPNIVTVFEHGQSGSFFYLMMEFVDGVNLRQAMRAGRFTPTQALAVVPGICDALQAAHAQGVWHRDIKPENILLDARGPSTGSGQGGVKIADFGIARIVGDPGRDFTLTATGAALGSAAYMAPEQHESPHDVDHRADIYSLGVVIYEMLTGELPLGRFPAPSARAAVDARIDEIVFRTLEKERELRQQSAAEVKTDVTRAAALPQVTQPGRPPSMLTVMSIALLVAGFVMPGAAVLFTGGSDQGFLLTLGIAVLATGYVFAWFVFWMMRRERIEKTWRGWLRIAAWAPLLAVLAVPAYLIMEERVLANSRRAEAAMREMEKARGQIEAIKRDAKQPARQVATDGEKSAVVRPAEPAVPFLEWAQGEWIMDREESLRATAALYPDSPGDSPGVVKLRNDFKPYVGADRLSFLPEAFEFWQEGKPDVPVPSNVWFFGEVMHSPLPKPDKDASPDQLAVTLRLRGLHSPAAQPWILPVVFSKTRDGLLQWTLQRPQDGVKLATVYRRYDGKKDRPAQATDVESWTYTLRHLDAAKLDAQMKANPQAGVATKVEAGVVTLTGPRDAVRPLATMLRVLDQPEVKDPLDLPLFNMPPDFFTRLAIPALMTGTEFQSSQFEEAFFATLQRENVTAPQLARALSAHVLELEKAKFVNTGTPFESIIHTPGASTFYDGTIPCADQPDKPLTLRIRRTTQTMGTKPDIAALAPWLIEEAKQQSREPMPERLGKSAPVAEEKPPAVSVEEVVRQMNTLANESNGAEFKKHLSVSKGDSSELLAYDMKLFVGRLRSVKIIATEPARPDSLAGPNPVKMTVFATIEEVGGAMQYQEFGFRAEEGAWRFHDDLPARYRAACRIEFRPEKGNATAILRTWLGEKVMLSAVSGTDGEFDISAEDLWPGNAKDAANDLAEKLQSSLKKVGQDGAFKIIRRAERPAKPWRAEEAPALEKPNP